MKKILCLFVLVSSTAVSLTAMASEFPTGTFECKHDYSQARDQFSATIKISEVNLSGVSLPLVEYTGPATGDFSGHYKGIATVTTANDADKSVILTIAMSQALSQIHFDKNAKLIYMQGDCL